MSSPFTPISSPVARRSSAGRGGDQAVAKVLRAIFGAHGQLAVGVVACVVTLAAWGYGSTLHGEALIRFLFHMSMFFGLLAAYAIVATALGYRATERVEAAVVENIENAGEVAVTGSVRTQG